MDSTTIPFVVQFAADLPFAVSLTALYAQFVRLVDQRGPRGVCYPLAPLLTMSRCCTCPIPPCPTPGGTSAGGRTTCSFSASYGTGEVAPHGSLTFTDPETKSEDPGDEL